MNLGVFADKIGRGRNLTELAALGLAALWVLICVIFIFTGSGPSNGEGVGFIVGLAIVIVPIAVGWLAFSAARSARIVADESAHLQVALKAMRQTVLDAQHSGSLIGARADDLPRKLEDIAAKPRQNAEAPAVFASSRHPEEQLPPPAFHHAAPPARPMRDVSPRAAVAAPGEDQPSLALGTPAGVASGSVAVKDLIRAINFPENAEDEAGFDALRRALADRTVATLIQASQDVLTLLSQDGIYMDDLQPDQARPEVWRRFADGQRGRPVAALGGIRDRSSLALTANRMRSDAVFRDTSMHFLRQFDQVLTAFAPKLDDAQMARFSATRTARAFMLLGRVTGTFD
ncbi:MAG: hypothetical protein KDK10_05900 [Maritimibacter sp.]|nr:hypothetical protein [Maritimibacter sp.]